jgi:hypothetical protein
MADNDNPSSENDSIENQISAASKKLNIDIDILRQISPEEIQYLLDHWPFLQMLDPEAKEPGSLRLIRAWSGWIIQDYGDAMSSSPGELIFGGGDFRLLLDEDEGGKAGDIINPGKGTIWNQAYWTAAEMVNLAVKRGWGVIHLVSGHPMMKWAAWMRALDEEIPLQGFVPSEKDHAKRERVKRPEIDEQMLRQLRRK